MLDELDDLLGAANVLRDEASCVLYAQDLYMKDIPALAVARPGSTEELARLVAAVTGAGHAIIARGGGMSYTSGYVPHERGSVIVDMRRMDRVLEINTEDMYVTAESGCTWQALHEVLDGTGYRTPFWGTLSGIHATVGGSLSQNGIFWGSSRHGSVADSVLSLDVVLADGTIVRTGANAQTEASPFFRHYGPDLTGLFTCDAGALGFKATATLRLIPACEFNECLAFDFADHASVVRVMSAISRAGLADECFAFDPRLHTVRMQRESLMNDVRQFAGVLKSAGSIVGAIRDGAKVALAGRGFMKDVAWSLQVMIDDRTQAGATAAAEEVRALCDAEGGREIENSIPKILRANPFGPLNNIIGPNGERWVPLHTIVPHSRAESTMAAVQAVFERNDVTMEEFGIGYGFLLATVAHNGFVIEPVFFTPDALDEIHRETVQASVLRRIRGFDANPDAAAATARIRGEVIEAFRKAGGIHMQIGKSYPYREGLESDTYALVEKIKHAVDPACRVNPGSLGLDRN